MGMGDENDTTSKLSTMLEVYSHWVRPDGSRYDRQSMREAAARTLEELRRQCKPASLPQDGSSGQYDAWTRSLVHSILDDECAGICGV